MLLESNNLYDFDKFRLDVTEKVLLREGKPVAITPKVFTTLKLLVENAGRLLEKDTMMEAIWPDQFVEEGNLAYNIKLLRKALGDDASRPSFIETIPRRGYRFMAKVSVLQTESGASLMNGKNFINSPLTSVSTVQEFDLTELSTTLSDKSTVKIAAPSSITGGLAEPKNVAPGGRRVGLLVIACITLLLLGTYIVSFVPTNRTTLNAVDKKRFAVLPLKPVNIENRDAIIEMAIAESLILKLSAGGGLRVLPLTAVRRYVDLDKDPLDAGNQLGVDFVLSSNYQVANGRIRVTSMLMNVRTGQTDASFISEHAVEEMFSMQDAIANQIGNGIVIHLGGQADIFAVKRGTANEAAYSLYMHGMYLTEKYNRDDAGRAIEVFDEALRLDPNYAAAWAGKAHAHCNFAHRGGNPPRVEFSKAEPALDYALAIDKNNADAYAVRGIINRDYHWNFVMAHESLDRALEINPNHAFARGIRSGLLTRDGRHDEAIMEIKKAIDLNPRSLWEHWLYADALIQARRYDEAIQQANRVREMDSSLAAAHYILWVAYHFKGDHALAYENFLQSKRLWGSNDVDIAKLEGAFRDSGWLGVLRTDRDALIAKLTTDYSPSKYKIAGLSAVLGDDQLALTYLNDCLEKRLVDVSYIKVDPFFDTLRDDTQFIEVLRRTGL